MARIESPPPLCSRPSDAHKGDFGRILIIAGSRQMSGAAALAGRAALRSGAGLVRIATPASAHPLVASFEPCYTTIPLPEDHIGQIDQSALPQILNRLNDNDVLAIGPGLGQSPALRDLLQELIRIPDLKLVIDADGLNNLSKIRHWQRNRQAQIVLTPHPGEMQRLWTSIFRSPPPIMRDQWAQTLAQETQTTVVLKGHETVVTNGQDLYINPTGNPGMATGGSGDVLTGILSALIGQGLSLMNAAITATYIQGLAGDLGAQEKGQISLIATDIIDHLPQAFKTIKKT